MHIISNKFKIQRISNISHHHTSSHWSATLYHNSRIHSPEQREEEEVEESKKKKLTYTQNISKKLWMEKEIGWLRFGCSLSVIFKPVHAAVFACFFCLFLLTVVFFFSYFIFYAIHKLFQCMYFAKWFTGCGMCWEKRLCWFMEWTINRINLAATRNGCVFFCVSWKKSKKN